MRRDSIREHAELALLPFRAVDIATSGLYEGSAGKAREYPDLRADREKESGNCLAEHQRNQAFVPARAFPFNGLVDP